MPYSTHFRSGGGDHGGGGAGGGGDGGGGEGSGGLGDGGGGSSGDGGGGGEGSGDGGGGGEGSGDGGGGVGGGGVGGGGDGAMPYGSNAGFFSIPEEDRGQKFDVALVPEGLPEMKPEDVQYFAPLLKETDEEALTIEEQKERKIMRLLLRVKNGTPQQRKTSLRQITDRAKEFGAGPLFNQILPLLMSPTLEDQERHLLVKVIDRILYKLDDLVRPYVHKILVVIEPLLIDEDYYARVEGREIITGNLVISFYPTHTLVDC